MCLGEKQQTHEAAWSNDNVKEFTTDTTEATEKVRVEKLRLGKKEREEWEEGWKNLAKRGGKEGAGKPSTGQY